MTETPLNDSDKTGLPPGTLMHVGEVLQENIIATHIDYSKDEYEEQTISSIEEILPYLDKDSVTWLNVAGLGDINTIETIGRALNIHPLVLEDILNTNQRPKVEEHEDYIYIVLKKLSCQNRHFSVEYEQVSILLLDNLVVTFVEKSDDIFDALKKRLNNGKGRLRSFGADYLTYAILDTLVDNIFILLDQLDEAIESLEEGLLVNPSTETLATIQQLKRELIYLRRSVSPLREMVAEVLRSDSLLIQAKTQIYYRDVYDHVLRIHESIESYRDMLSGLLDIYMSSVSNKMNEVMKVLTVFASIFIPLTFIAGIYGMNFEFMPELKWKWAYPALWSSFIIIVVVLLVYFKKKKWL
jgi:magnesium transporter